MKPVPPDALIVVPLPLPDLSAAAHNGDAHVRAGAVFALGDMASSLVYAMRWFIEAFSGVFGFVGTQWAVRPNKARLC